MAILLWLGLPLGGCGDLSPLFPAENGGDSEELRDADAFDPPPVFIHKTVYPDYQSPFAVDKTPWPVILVHGFSGFNSLGPLEYFFGIVDQWQQEGAKVYAPALPPYGSSEDRALALAGFIDQVREESGAEKVHLIAHSQGGVDARKAVSAYGYGDVVATLTTIATPHRGTPLADYAAILPNGSLDPLGLLLGWMLGGIDSPPNEAVGAGWDATMAGAVAQLSSDGMEAFNQAHPDDPRVRYFSVAGVSNLISGDSICDQGLWGGISRVDAVDPLLIASGAMLSGFNIFNPKPNDGIVPTASMVWGEFLGCIPADHFDEVGQIADLIPGLISGFDHRHFYDVLLAHIRQVEAELRP